MAEKDIIFSSKIKYKGIFSFRDFYRFCYDWLTDETELDVAEEKYKEKLEQADEKYIEVKWRGIRKVTDYFEFEVKVEFRMMNLTDVEVQKEGTKIKMNKGTAEMKVKGTLIKDYKGKFERGAFRKFLRGIYERWIITARVEQFEDKLIEDCDEFLNQAKAYLDLEGKK